MSKKYYSKTKSYCNESEQQVLGRPTEDATLSLAREEFFDLTNRKIFLTKMRREFNKTKILFDINLEERRMKLRELLNQESQDFMDEYFRSLDSTETRKKKLIDTAFELRKTKELERQEIAKAKYDEAFRLNSDSIRHVQSEQQTIELVKDWEKLKEYKARLKREQDCENDFWHKQKMETEQDFINKDEAKRMQQLNREIACQKENLKKIEETNKAKDENLQVVKENVKQAEKYSEIMKVEDEEIAQNKKNKKMEYRKELDEQMRIKKCMDQRYPSYEKAYDDLSHEENVKKLSEIVQSLELTKASNMRSFSDHIHYQNCKQKNLDAEDKLLNAQVIKSARELERKRKHIESLKNVRSKQLIAEIKEAQKYQLVESQLKKKEALELELLEKIRIRKQYEESLEEEKREKLKKQEIVMKHWDDLKEQLKFNSQLRQCKKQLRKHEIDSMLQAEKDYLARVETMRNNEHLLFQHPWRVNDIN